jgi:hypothetical protein
MSFDRSVAKRVFANELKHTMIEIEKAMGDDKAPNFVLTPTGAKCNRILIMGTITEKDDIGAETEYWRARIVDPTGNILVYAGAYNQDAMESLIKIEPPTFVAVIGKPNIYKPEGEDARPILSIRAEYIREVSKETVDRWSIETALQTIDRCKAETHDRMAAIEGYGDQLDTYSNMAIEVIKELAAPDEVAPDVDETEEIDLR